MITAKAITKEYRTPILTSAEADFPLGEVTFLMGANGSGKTTFFKCLLGLESYSGSFSFDGQQFSTIQNEVFSIFDDTPLYPNLDGYANVEMLTNQRMSKDALADAWQLGLGWPGPEILKRPAKTYSSGQRKRLMLAAAVLCNPRYIILDEVASGLDLESMDAAVTMIQKLKPSSVIIASGHQFDFYSRIVDRVVVLRAGILKEIEEYDSGDASALERIYRSNAIA